MDNILKKIKTDNYKIIDGFLTLSPESAHSTSGFNPDYFEKLHNHEKKYFWFKNRAFLIQDHIRKYFISSKSFLEIGCGTGLVCGEIKKNFNLDVYGSEILVKGLDFAQQRTPSACFFQMDACNIPFENEFDIIGSFDVLEHIENDQLVLNQIHKALSPGGGLIITVPQHQFLWSKTDELAHHVRRYSRKDLVQKVENAGFEVLKVTSFVSILFPLMLISRLLDKNNKEYNIDKEFEISPFLNKILYALLTLERFLINTVGINLPFGGSLILIARKR